MIAYSKNVLSRKMRLDYGLSLSYTLNHLSFSESVLQFSKLSFVQNFLNKCSKIFAKIFEKQSDNTTHKKTVLIAEDDEFNFLYLKTILSEEEINLLRAINGKEAVEIVESNPNIDLILMDLKMPIMNGFEATKKIRKIHKDIPIIAQTAYSTIYDEKKAIESGCSDYICKPFSSEDLLQKIYNQLK